MTDTKIRRLLTVAAATAAALAVWVVADPIAGADLAVRRGGSLQHIGPVPVFATALIAGLAGWALLATLERTTERPARIWTVITLIVLALSLTGPLGSGDGLAARLALTGMHLAVGAVLIPLLPRHAHGKTQNTRARS